MISIICICNNRRMYNNYLLPSLAKQRNCNYEIIRIDNEKNEFSSAIAAFNSVIKEAKGEHLMFIHQDVALEDDLFLSKVQTYMDTYNNVGIAGVAGAKEKTIYSNIYHSLPRVLVSDVRLDDVVEVNGLDECLFIISKETILKYPFDELTCNNWHLYAVEYCYQMKKLNKSVVVLPLDAYHASYGDFMNDGYYDSLVNVAKKHNEFKTIDTTLRSWSTNYLVLKLNIEYLKRKKRGMMKRV